MTTPDHQLANTTITQLSEVKAQLQLITTLIQNNHAATHQRIDDLRHDINNRLGGHEARIGRLEQNERSTAVRASTAGALSGLAGTALVQGLMALIRGH